MNMTIVKYRIGRFCTLMSALVGALLLAGCNGDVFIGDDVPPSTDRIEVADGGEAVFAYGTDDLECISVTLPEYDIHEVYIPDNPWEDGSDEDYPVYLRSDFDYVCECHDEAGLVSTENVSSVSGDISMYLGGYGKKYERIVIRNAVLGFEVSREKHGRIRVRSIENTSGRDVGGKIEFYYPGRVEEVAFTIASTLERDADYEIVGIRYADDVSIRTREYTDSIPVRHDNVGSDSVKIPFSVAENCRVRVGFGLNPIHRFRVASGVDVQEVEIPTYRNVEDDYFVHGLLWGEKVPFSFDGVDVGPFDSALIWQGDTFYRNYIFNMAPRQGVKALFKVARLKIEAVASLRIRNTSNGRETELPVKVRVDQPWLYNMYYEKFNLDE